MVIESAIYRITPQNQSVPLESKHMWTIFSQDMVMFLIPVQMCVFGGEGGGLPHQQAMLWHQPSVLWFNSIRTLPPWTMSQIPQVKDQPRKTPFLISPSPTAHFQTPITSPGCYLYFWPAGYRSEVPTTLSTGLVNVREQFTELRETFYLLDHPFIIKGHN